MVLGTALNGADAESGKRHGRKFLSAAAECEDQEGDAGHNHKSGIKLPLRKAHDEFFGLAVNFSHDPEDGVEDEEHGGEQSMWRARPFFADEEQNSEKKRALEGGFIKLRRMAGSQERLEAPGER